MTDKEMADKIREAISNVASLMNEAKLRGIAVNFSINESEDMRTNPPGKIFMPLVTITKEIK